MRTSVIKIVLPMAVVALGLVSAAGTSSLDKKFAPKMGYNRINVSQSCSAVAECGNAGGDACTAPDGNALFQQGACLVPLTKNYQ
ncbi:hypothetical protein [Flavobacterium aestuarii]|uniref:hypothetical protein n=1 Tax=Flavobacterium aestuarii TaxID=3149227 RepID=UPI0032B30FE1